MKRELIIFTVFMLIGVVVCALVSIPNLRWLFTFIGKLSVSSVITYALSVLLLDKLGV